MLKVKERLLALQDSKNMKLKVTIAVGLHAIWENAKPQPNIMYFLHFDGFHFFHLIFIDVSTALTYLISHKIP